ncbi:MAG: hypothetical protein Q8S15_00705 [Erysipelotrichaceae bacterium]|nr:hypothetical protein [Erysipelotrichaceae bacterium]MDP3304582.1 hypothetical protein [Erysipelotrichaceae bacterium]
MKKDEISKINDFMMEKNLVTREELLSFILKINPERNSSYLRFYLIDLIKANVLHKFNDRKFKYNGKLKPFSYEYTKSDLLLQSKIEDRFDNLDICIWNTGFLSLYLNLMPIDYYTIVETNKQYLELVFDFLKHDYNVLLEPNKKELEFYMHKENQIILKKLNTRAPLDKPYNSKIAANVHISRSSRIVFKPSIEKILVDIYAESSTYSFYSELNHIFEGALKAYCVNFQKLFYYAKNRGIYEEISKFVENELSYDLNRGEFRC